MFLAKGAPTTIGIPFSFGLSRSQRQRIRRASLGCNMQSAAFLPRIPQHHSHLCRSDNFLGSHHSTWTCPKWKLAASRIAVTRMSPPASTSHSLSSETSLAALAPLEAILFDIDGTLCDSDPIHYYAFREMLQEVGFNGGIPITEEFFVKKISGMHNEELCHVLFPDWEIQKASKFMEDKEEMFRRLASEKLEPVKGLPKLLKWIEGQGMRRAAVTNAPRPNAELILSLLGLNDFFETLVIGSECERAKPFPHPYLKALEVLGVSEKHAFVFEDSVSGTKAGVAAGMPVVALGTRNPKKLLTEAGAAFVIMDFLDPKLWKALDELEKDAGVTGIET